MSIFRKKKEPTPIPPLAALEYRTGDGWHWGFHYRLSKENGGTLLHYSREMPEQLQCIAAPETVWEELRTLCDRYDVMSWAGFDQCRTNVGRTKRWLLYLTFSDGETLRAEGCGVYPKNHEKAENELLFLLNNLIDIEE